MIERLFLHPIHDTRLLEIRKAVYQPLCEFSARVFKSREPITPDKTELDAFRPIKRGEVWAGIFDCGWFEFKTTVPAGLEGKRVVALLSVGGEGLVYSADFKPMQSITGVLSTVDPVQTTIGKQAVELSGLRAGEELTLYADCGYNGNCMGFGVRKEVKLKRCELAVLNEDVLGFYYDYLTLYALTLTYGENAELTAERVKAVNTALASAFGVYKKQGAAAARAALAPSLADKGVKSFVQYTAVGHAHLDLGWLWPIRETKRKAARTFATALVNLQLYPDYVFGASQAQQFDWLKKLYPDIYEGVKRMVDCGRIELQGGMWTENDCNNPCGESLIKQFIYGDEFFYREFGKRSRMVWLPDTFGYPGCLPQIYKGCEKDYFMTIKLSWNEQNVFPYRTFVWKGIDGSEVLAHLPPSGDYNASNSPLYVARAQKLNTQKDSVDKALIAYGAGDGGGGAGEGHLQYLSRIAHLEGLNNVKSGAAEPFFDELNQQRGKLPVYEGELYLEKHQGTLTSQARNKQFNAVIERELHNTELLCAMALCQGKSYPKEEIKEIYREVLLYQFHDILPGSSIQRIYDESRARYDVMLARLKRLQADLSAELGETFYVNTSPFARQEYVEKDGKYLLATAEPYARATLSEDGFECLKANDGVLENDLLTVRFAKGGEICSLKDKASGKEYAANGLNVLTLYSDPRLHYNAWDISIDYPKMRSTRLKIVSARCYVEGARAVIEQVFRTAKSTITQRTVLYKGDRLVRFETHADWHESYRMLRADFRPTVFSETADFDIQFGAIKRSTKNETSIEKAQYEVCAHKFVNVEKDGYGFATVDCCKFGHKAKDGLISTNLLRSPKYPDPTCDMGEHDFVYGIYPYVGDLEHSGLVSNAYRLTYPLSRCYGGASSFVALEGDGAVIETVKPSEDGKGVVVRIYERYGRNAKVKLNASFSYAKLYSCNMLERQKEPCGSEVELTPYQIRTFYFETETK